MATYARPTELTQALGLLADRRTTTRPMTILAGGTDHYPARATVMPDEDILDITGLAGLRRITEAADHWFIPCGATWTDVIEAGLPPVFDAMVAAARQVGGMQVQNAGTICGNLCNASPAADGIPVLLALDAQVELASLAGRRLLPVADFMLGNRRTARQPQELVTGLRIPRPALATARSCFLKLGSRRYLVISIVMVAAVAEFTADGRIACARIAVGACSETARRLPALEAALQGASADPALVQAEHLAPLSPLSDIRADAAYRLQAALELLRRAIASLGSAAERQAA